MVVPASDEQLTQAVAAGDVQALEALYDRYERAVYSFALQALGDPAEAEQAVVESFRRVWQEASGYHPGRGRFALWLYHLSQAAVAEHWRLRRRREPQGADAGAVTLLSRQLRRALSGLPPELVQAVELAYFRGYTQVEIAERIGIPLGAVRVRLMEAFNLLRNSLARTEAATSLRGQHDLDAGLAAVYTLNLLPAYAARQFEAHLAGCEPCSAEFAGFQAVGEILFHAVPLSEPDPGLKARVLEQVEHTAVEVLPQTALPLARVAALGAAELESLRSLAPVESETAVTVDMAPAGAEPAEPRWAPAPILPGTPAGDDAAPARPISGRRPRPVRSIDRQMPEPAMPPEEPEPEESEERPALQVPERRLPQAFPEPPQLPPLPDRFGPVPARPAPRIAAPPPVAPETVLPAPAPIQPPAFRPAPAPIQPPAFRPAPRRPESDAGTPPVRPAPLRAPVANPVAPHMLVPGAAATPPPVEGPRRREPPAESSFPPAPVAAQPAPSRRQGELRRDEALDEREEGVAVARPRRPLDPIAAARRQAALSGLERPLLPAAEPEAMEMAVEGLRRRPSSLNALWVLLGVAAVCFVIALAGAMLYSSTELWKRIAELESLAISRDLSLQKAEAELARRQPEATAAPTASVQVVSLAPPTGSTAGALGQLALVVGPGDRYILVHVAGLSAPRSGEVYQAWVLKKGGTAESVGMLDIDASGRGSLKTVYYAPEEYQELFITRENGRAASPAGPRLLQGTLQS